MRIIKSIFLLILFVTVGSSSEIISYKGVVDRMENDQAIILINSINKELVVPMNSLPFNAQVNDWLHIEFIDHTYKIVSIDHQLTEKRKRKSTYLINQLRKKTESK